MVTPSSPGLEDGPMRQTLEERLEEYRPGSIQRVRLQNFLTYSDVEFRPGPRLNVVIGPNGTGKSTILCAICLGLGGQPTLLGRADDARLFIMHEKERASIELELTPKDSSQPPDVIKRIIERNKGAEKGRGIGASTFYINGKKNNLKSVRTLVETYHIAVDNLCTFLPQDRVGSFSGFTPKDLLIETEKAIGIETLYEPHLELQRLEAEVCNESNEKVSIEERLKVLEQENVRLEREKKLMEERQEAMKKVKLLEQKRVWLQFDQARELAVAMKGERDKCKTELNSARQILAPLEQKSENLKAEVEMIKSRSKTLEEASRKALTEYEKGITKAQNFQDNIDEEASQLTSIDSVQRQQHRNTERMKEKVRELEVSLTRDFPPMEEAEEHQRKTQAEYREVKKRNDHAKKEAQNINTICKELEEQIYSDTGKLEKMRDEKKRRQERLFRQQPKLGEAYNWIDQNRKMFRRPVWGPIAGEISIKGENAAAYLEQHVSYSILKSFVVECKEDYNLLYRELRTKRDIPVNVNIVNNGKLEPISRMYSKEKIRILRNEHGIIGYLDESFDAPEAVLQALITTSSVHAVLVGNDKTQESLDKRGLLDYLSEKENGTSGKMSACIFSRSGNNSYKYTSMVSRYSGKSSIRVDEINPARMLAPGTNPELRERLEREIESKKKELDDLNPKKIAAYEAADKVLKEGQHVVSRLKDLKSTINSINSHKLKINNTKRKLLESEELMNKDYEAEKKQIAEKIKKLIKLSMSELQRVARSQSKIFDCVRALAGVKMTQDGIAASAQRTIDILTEKRNETRALEDQVAHANARFTEAKRRMKELKNHADQIAPMKDAEGNDLPLRAKLQELPETLGEVEATIADIQDMIQNITENPEVLKLYEERKREIKKIREDYQNLENAESIKKAKVDSLLSDWRSRLHNIVANVNALFSGYMADLGCAGEIKLATGGSAEDNSDFSNWGIEIRVKFREKSSLQTLSAQVQSGGERSVSTIMYLMALQELMTSPFRCVDEINQGLDERNERLVFRRIVQNSTKLSNGNKNEHCGQYFLITPKLLPNLTDMENEHVTILFIFNGPYNFSHFSDWNCDKFLGFEGENTRTTKRRKVQDEGSDSDVVTPKRKSRVGKPSISGGEGSDSDVVIPKRESRRGKPSINEGEGSDSDVVIPKRRSRRGKPSINEGEGSDSDVVIPKRRSRRGKDD